MAIVLIVEDEEQVRVLADSILQEHGHKTRSAGTSEQAIALLDGDAEPELLFTDLGLHGDAHEHSVAHAPAASAESRRHAGRRYELLGSIRAINRAPSHTSMA
jgi:CheY-like chemotaxis protein